MWPKNDTMGAARMSSEVATHYKAVQSKRSAENHAMSISSHAKMYMDMNCC